MSPIIDSQSFITIRQLMDLGLTLKQAETAMELMGIDQVPSAINLMAAVVTKCGDIVDQVDDEIPLDPDLTEMAEAMGELFPDQEDRHLLEEDSDLMVIKEMAELALTRAEDEVARGDMPVMFAHSRHQVLCSEFGSIGNVKCVIAGARAILAVIPLGALPRLKA